MLSHGALNSLYPFPGNHPWISCLTSSLWNCWLSSRLSSLSICIYGWKSERLIWGVCGGFFALVYPFSSQIPFQNRKTKSMDREGQLVGLIVTRHKTVNSEHRGLGSQDKGSVVRQFSLLCRLSCGSLCYVITATFHLSELYLNPVFVGIPFCSPLSCGIAPFHTWFYGLLSETGKQAG